MGIKTKVFVNIFFYITFVFCLEVGYSYFVINVIGISSKRNELTDLTKRVSSDLVYKDGKWNTEMYLSDPRTPHPQGSSGFLTPLYVVTTDGFVIERNFPIAGLLDSSDYKHLSEFVRPQFVQATTNEKWRVVSKFIKEGNQNVGIVFVSIYNPTDGDLSVTDKILEDGANNILGNIKVIDGNIDVSNVDIRNVNYNISFEIVNSFNKVLLNNGRTPSFIDPSYVYDELKNNNRTIYDAKTSAPYYIVIQRLTSSDDKTNGIVVAGTPIQDLKKLNKYYLVCIIMFDLVIIVPLLFLSVDYFSKAMKLYSKKLIMDENIKNIPKQIGFNKKNSYIQIDNQKFDIPYASNQYYLCLAIFSHPQKRWEVDELSDKIGEEDSEKANRKIYDAILAINKKIGIKLIIHKDKTYKIDPDYLHIISNIL